MNGPGERAPADSPAGLNVFFICTGVGIYNRGIESFFREAYDGLRLPLERDGITARLFKGGEADVPERREKRLWCLPRTGKASALIGKILRRPPYAVEQMTFLPGIIRQIRR